MKKIFTILVLLISISTHAQKILSHTTTLGMYADSSIEFTEYTNGTSCYTVWLSSGDIKSIGTKIIKTNVKKVNLEFNTKEQMLNCLRFLYEFNKGEGYYIDLENKSNNMVTSTKKGFIVGAIDQIDKPLISKWLIGKMLNVIGVSVVKKGDKNNMSDDDMYKNESPLF